MLCYCIFHDNASKLLFRAACVECTIVYWAACGVFRYNRNTNSQLVSVLEPIQFSTYDECVLEQDFYPLCKS